MSALGQNPTFKSSAITKTKTPANCLRAQGQLLMVKHIVLGWQISTGHGWGVYGLNLALNWASDSEIESATSVQLDSTIIDIDPMRTHALAPFFKRSLEFQYSLQKFANTE